LCRRHPSWAYALQSPPCRHFLNAASDGVTYIKIHDEGSTGAPGTSGYYYIRTQDAVYQWNQTLSDAKLVFVPAGSALNIFVGSRFFGFMGAPTYRDAPRGLTFFSCADDGNGNGNFIFTGDDAYYNRTVTDNYPTTFDASGLNPLFGQVGTMVHELGHAMGIDHVVFGGCATPVPIMVVSSARWDQCADWQPTADDRNGVDFYYPFY